APSITLTTQPPQAGPRTAQFSQSMSMSLTVYRGSDNNVRASGASASNPGQAAEQGGRAEGVGTVPAYPVGDLLVRGDHHDRAARRFGPDQPPDQLVGGLPLAGEEDPDAAWGGRQPDHALGAVEDHGDLRAGLRGQPAQAVDQAAALLLQRDLREAGLGDVVAVDDQVRLGQAQQPVQPGRVVGFQRAGLVLAGTGPAGGLGRDDVGREQAGRFEGQLATQPDRGLPDRLQQQPEPGVVDL